jgi:hypothetical protein
VIPPKTCGRSTLVASEKALAIESPDAEGVTPSIS